MIEDEVKQTRCTTCDADHEYKQAKRRARRRSRSPPWWRAPKRRRLASACADQNRQWSKKR